MPGKEAIPADNFSHHGRATYHMSPPILQVWTSLTNGNHKNRHFSVDCLTERHYNPLAGSLRLLVQIRLQAIRQISSVSGEQWKTEVVIPFHSGGFIVELKPNIFNDMYEATVLSSPNALVGDPVSPPDSPLLDSRLRGNNGGTTTFKQPCRHPQML
ncbi:MAG: hypothetical protein KDJ38_18550 [Gammaproteobacteria bacterium]|nr:hypothetical protein [Gammaproteobacteria bacterium]